MSPKKNSEVAVEVGQRLMEKRNRDGLKDKALAEALGLTASTLSKRWNDLSTTPDDTWIALVAGYTKMPEEQLASLLARAGLERARMSPRHARGLLTASWTRICEHLALPYVKLPQPDDRAKIFFDAFASIGLNIRDTILSRKVTEFADQTSFEEAKSGDLLDLFQEVIQRLLPQSLRRQPTFGDLLDELHRRHSIRRFPLRAGISTFSPSFSHQVGAPGRQMTARSVPVLPGVLIHYVTAKEGTVMPRHSHDGIEALLVLNGSIEMSFDSQMKFTLNAENPELLLYEASVSHEGRAICDAAVVVMHYSPKLARKWDVVVRLYKEANASSQ